MKPELRKVKDVRGRLRGHVASIGPVESSPRARQARRDHASDTRAPRWRYGPASRSARPRTPRSPRAPWAWTWTGGATGSIRSVTGACSPVGGDKREREDAENVAFHRALGPSQRGFAGSGYVKCLTFWSRAMRNITPPVRIWTFHHHYHVALDCVRLARRWRARGREDCVRVAMDLARFHRDYARAHRGAS